MNHYFALYLPDNRSSRHVQAVTDNEMLDSIMLLGGDFGDLGNYDIFQRIFVGRDEHRMKLDVNTETGVLKMKCDNCKKPCNRWFKVLDRIFICPECNNNLTQTLIQPKK